MPHGPIIIKKEGSIVTTVRSVSMVNYGRSESISRADNVETRNKAGKVQHTIRNQPETTLDGTNMILIEVKSANLQDQNSWHEYTSMQ